MERTEVLELMGALKLYGMRSAYDEIMGVAIKRQHEPPRIVGDLLQAEISEKQARSIKYQFAVAKLPLAKDIDDFDFADTPVTEPLMRDLAPAAPSSPISATSSWSAAFTGHPTRAEGRPHCDGRVSTSQPCQTGDTTLSERSHCPKRFSQLARRLRSYAN